MSRLIRWLRKSFYNIEKTIEDHNLRELRNKDHKFVDEFVNKLCKEVPKLVLEEPIQDESCLKRLISEGKAYCHSIYGYTFVILYKNDDLFVRYDFHNFDPRFQIFYSTGGAKVYKRNSYGYKKLWKLFADRITLPKYPMVFEVPFNAYTISSYHDL